MASLKAVAQLEHNVSGCIVSIRIPSADISKFHAEKTIVDINCKHFFNKLCKATIQPTQQVSGISSSSNAETDPAGIVFTKPARITNRYDNIIDQLERKYYGESMVQANQEAENSEDSEGSDGGEGELNDLVEVNEPVSKKSKAKSNKRKVCSDDYDVEDPFIDDEELIMEVETSLKTHRTKTKHDGFFVSSGKLEVFSPKKAQKVSNQNTAKSSAPAQKKEVEKVAPAAEVPVEEPLKEGEGSEKKKRKRRTKKEMEEAALAKGAPTASPAPSSTDLSAAQSVPTVSEGVEAGQSSIEVIAGDEGVGSPDGPATFVTKSKPEKVLPAWMPDDESLLAMVHFKSVFEGTGIKLFKSSHIPKSLEEPLHVVDLVVLKSSSAESLQKTSGYYEGLHAILGGEVAIGKLRSLLARLRLRDRANAALQNIDEQMSALVADLKRVTVPCPEKLQPAFKAAKRAQSALAKAAEGEAKESTEPRQEDDEDHEGGGEEPSAALNTTMDTIEGPVVGSPSATQGTAGTRYEWVCNWTKPMKVALCAIEHALKLWVIQENQYREKLTVYDKKYLHDRDCVPLVEKDVIAAYFERICNTAFDPLCLQGTTSYMRRVITMLNKVPKEKAPKPVASSAPSAGSAIVTQVLPEEESAVV